MNWERYDGAHLAFYGRLIDRYHDLDALDADAALDPLEPGTDLAVTAFVREAGGTADVSGPRAVLVVLSFEADPVAVDLPPCVEPTDLVEPSDGAAISEGEEPPSDAESAGTGGSTVAVDTVGVFPLERSLDGTPVVRPIE
jgi:hypothetical protein